MTKKFLFALLLCFTFAIAQNPCANYMIKLAQLYNTNRTKFNSQIAPYALLSGKNIDDLGYPDYCVRNKNYKYTTVQAKVITNSSSKYNVYMGFCFTSKCSPSQLNEYAQFVVDYILEDYEVEGKVKFVEPALNLEFSATTLATCLVFLLIVIISMASPVLGWINIARQSEQEEYIIKSTYIDLQNPDKDFEEEEITEQSTLLERLSLKYKWKQLWKQEETMKIKSFTLFRFIAVPLIIYGQYFYLTNQAAFNYTSFNEEIYQSFYAKFAMFSYYIPDIFFFISGFLFARKVFTIDEMEQNKNVSLIKTIAKRFARLYPVYIAVFIIYWLVTPGLHSGPVWFVYQEQAAVCNGNWWRVILLIDNWFPSSCYPALWFVQVEYQLTFFAGLFFIIYFVNKKASIGYLILLLVTSWTLLFVLSGDLITTVDAAVNSYSQLYFRSFYSHMGFYLFGILMALLANQQNFRQFVKTTIVNSTTLMGVLSALSFGLIILIVLRPSVWESSGFELGLCRTGVLFSFVIFFLPGMFTKQIHKSSMHKFGYYIYPVILVSYMIAGCSFWAAGSFPYVSGLGLLNSMIPIFMISYALGLFLGLLFDLRTVFAK